MVLVCNDRQGAVEVLDTLPQNQWQHTSARIAKLKHQSTVTDAQLEQSPRYRDAGAIGCTTVRCVCGKQHQQRRYCRTLLSLDDVYFLAKASSSLALLFVLM